jgi:hypothetical protein
MIRTQMEKHNRSEMVAVYRIPYIIPSCNSNSAFVLLGHLRCCCAQNIPYIIMLCGAWVAIPLA